MTAKLLALSFVVAAASGCAGLQPAGADKAHLTLASGGAADQLRLEGRELYGSRVNVSFLSDGYRGVLDNRHIVDLRPSGDDKVVGSVAGGPTELYIEERPGWLRVHGLYRGRVGSLVMTSNRVQGLIGECSYALATSSREPGYVGGRFCGVGTSGASLTLPETFFERPAQERVVMLALLLGG